MPHVHEPGLVLQLDPTETLKHGARYSCAADDAVFDPHYFVCLRADAKEAHWLPLFKGPGPGRQAIAASAKSGAARFVKTTSFYHPGQVWQMSHKAAQRGAAAGYDQSTPRSQNRIALTALAAVAVAVPPAA